MFSSSSFFPLPRTVTCGFPCYNFLLFMFYIYFYPYTVFCYLLSIMFSSSFLLLLLSEFLFTPRSRDITYPSLYIFFSLYSFYVFAIFPYLFTVFPYFVSTHLPSFYPLYLFTVLPYFVFTYLLSYYPLCYLLFFLI